MPRDESHLLALCADWCVADAPQRQGLVQVEGAEAVRWLLRSSCAVQVIVGKASTLTSLRPDIDGVEPSHIVTRSRQEMAGLLGFPFDRGVVAVASRPAFGTWAQGCQAIAQRQVRRLVICDSVHDATNLGVILRSARCLGMDGVLVGDGCADPWSRRCIRVGVGHPLCMPLWHHPDIAAGVRALRECGVEVIAAHRGPVSQPLAGLSGLQTPWAVVVGNEDRGPQPQVVAACSQQRHIPMHHDTDSLNVATATTVFLHHLRHCETLVAPSPGLPHSCPP
ncbi:MAG: RNA methyltransferase [Planctomycetota bacterium]|nr:MAG: RNA methyltransferase [Planctomycetota bacterium]